MFKKLAYSFMIQSIVLISSAVASSNALNEFEEAWKNSAYTPYERPAQDINVLLKKQGKEDLQLKGTQL